MSQPSAAKADYDIVIAGGGLVGGSLAVALADLPARVLLIEAVPPESDDQPSFDDRSIALSHGSCRILRTLGLWDQLADTRSVWPITRIHVSEQKRFGTAVIDSDEQGVSELGYVIKSRDLGAVLWQRIRELDAVKLLCPGKVTAVESGAGVRQIEVSGAAGDQALTTNLLVAADGARSGLRSALNIEARNRNYDQVAIVANVQVDSRMAGHAAYERFTSQGPLAVLPGPDGRYTVVLARSSETASDALDMSDSDFLQLLQDAFGFRLGRLARIGKRTSYPLSLTTANQLIQDRAVLIGNAAHGLHPVAAQGFNLGLRDVACLAELIADGYGDHGDGFDPGGPDTLDAYCDWRSADHSKVVRFTDSLIRGFGSANSAVATGRGLALAGFDIFPGAKRMLAHQTMGLGGQLSRLARGLPL